VTLPDGTSEWTAEIRPGGVWVLTRRAADGSQERKRAWITQSGGKLWIQVDGRSWAAEPIAAGRAAAAGASADADLTAQFPGKVRKILVKAEQKVAAGDSLLLVEAMKTFNDIVAPRAGKVVAILVEDGQPVEYGEPLLVIE